MTKSKKVSKVTKSKKATKMEAVPAIALPPVELTELEKFYVKSKFEAGESISKINETLKKDEQLLKDYVESFKRKGPTQYEQTVCRKTVSGKDNQGITVASKASSEISDEARKQLKNSKIPIKYSNCITQIKEK